MLEHEGVFYWYGEKKDGLTYNTTTFGWVQCPVRDIQWLLLKECKAHPQQACCRLCACLLTITCTACHDLSFAVISMAHGFATFDQGWPGVQIDSSMGYINHMPVAEELSG